MILIPLSVEKCVFSCRFSATALPSDLLLSHKIYISTVPSKLSSLQSIIQISYPYSVAWVIYRKNSSRSEAQFCLSNKLIFYGERLLASCPTPKLEDQPLTFVRSCLFNIFTATLHSWRPFLHLQAEDAPCCGDRDPPNMAVISVLLLCLSAHFKSFYCNSLVLSLQFYYYNLPNLEGGTR
jgi:hypothetical protein